MPGPGLQGVMHTAAIYTRASGGWSDSGTTWRCRLQPISPMVKLHGEEYAQSTHLAVGVATPTIAVGYKLVIDGEVYFVHGSQQEDRPGVGRHHQEVYLTRSEAP